jgi:hypothetical protein
MVAKVPGFIGKIGSYGSRFEAIYKAIFRKIIKEPFPLDEWYEWYKGILHFMRCRLYLHL